MPARCGSWAGRRQLAKGRAIRYNPRSAGVDAAGPAWRCGLPLATSWNFDKGLRAQALVLFGYVR